MYCPEIFLQVRHSLNFKRLIRYLCVKSFLDTIRPKTNQSVFNRRWLKKKVKKKHHRVCLYIFINCVHYGQLTEKFLTGFCLVLSGDAVYILRPPPEIRTGDSLMRRHADSSELVLDFLPV